MINSKFDLFVKRGNNDKTKVLMFDAHNLLHRTLHIAVNDFGKKRNQYLIGETDAEWTTDDMYEYWLHIVISTIFSEVKRRNPDKLIFAVDGRGYWRKEIYKEYKASRKIVREKSDIDFDEFYKKLDEFINNLKELFCNVYVIELEKTEADDIIAVLVKKFSSDEFVVELISTDKDFLQLQKYKNFKQWDPVKKTYLQSINPEVELQIKVLCGDAGDYIPNVKSDSMNNKVRFGPKTAEKVINDGLDTFLEDENYFKNYKRNKQLIDFEYIPKDVSDVILKTYNEYEIKQINANNIWNWLLKNRLRTLADDWQNTLKYIKKLS